MIRSRSLAAVRDGCTVVLVGWAAGFAVTGVASVVYRPRHHVGSVLDWLRIGGWLVAMSAGAPLRVHSGADRGELRLVPLTITLVVIGVATRLGRRRQWTEALVSAAAAGVAVVLLALVTGSRLTSYGRHLQVHYSVAPVGAGVGVCLVVCAAHGLAGLGGGWSRAWAGALRGVAVVAAVAAVTAVGVLAWRFPASTLGAVPGLLGDGSAWLGGFSLGGRLNADLSSPIPFLSGDLGVGLVTGGARPVAYTLLVVPLVAAVVAGRRQQRDAVDVLPWAEFGRAAAVNGALWWVLAEATRLRFSGRLGADLLSGSAGLDPVSTVFVATLWGGVSAVAGLALHRDAKSGLDGRG